MVRRVLCRCRSEEVASMATVTVRYIVHDIDAAISFYCDLSGSRR